MITFPKIKAASYAIGKRLQGYHLLQNPSGTPQTEVNMVKTIHDRINKAGLRITITDRITQTFDDLGNTTFEKRNVLAYRIYDFNNKNFSKAENISVWIRNNKKSKVYERNNYTCSKLDNMLDHSIETMNGIQKQIQEFNKKIKIKRPNFFKVLYQNLRGKE